MPGIADTPMALDLRRPPAITRGVPILLGFAALAILWFFIREQHYGRFVPIPTGTVDEGWLREHMLRYPVVVVGANALVWSAPFDLVLAVGWAILFFDAWRKYLHAVPAGLPSGA